jgi:predicted RND superfamily exporter protein
MTSKTQSDAARRSERDSRIMSVVGCLTAFAGIALVLWLRKLGWGEAALYTALLAVAPVFGGMCYWMWRRNVSAPGGARRE